VSVAEAASELVDQVVGGGHSAVVLVRNVADGTQTSVFVSDTSEQTLATIASALDENPTLIGLFIGALRMVRNGGNNRYDPGFAPVIFAGEGAPN
jgi:hypothetical protein